MKRILLAVLFLLLTGAGVFLASPANATVNPETPPVTLPTCLGPTKTREPYPGETTTTVKIEPCVEVEYASGVSTERVEVPVLDEPLEVKGMSEVISLLKMIEFILVINVGATIVGPMLNNR